MHGGFFFVRARGVLPTSIELVAKCHVEARDAGTWVAGDGVIAI